MKLLRGGRPAAGRDQPRLRLRRRRSATPRSPSPDLAGIHFTGSTAVFHGMWQTVGENIARYRNYPRIVGETGGKDFIVAHPSRRRRRAGDGDRARLVRVPGPEVLGRVARLRAVEPLAGAARAARRGGRRACKMGDVADFSNFMGAVIDAQLVRDPEGGDRGGEGVRRHGVRCSSAAATTTATAGSSSRR